MAKSTYETAVKLSKISGLIQFFFNCCCLAPCSCVKNTHPLQLSKLLTPKTHYWKYMKYLMAQTLWF